MVKGCHEKRNTYTWSCTFYGAHVVFHALRLHQGNALWAVVGSSVQTPRGATQPYGPSLWDIRHLPPIGVDYSSCKTPGRILSPVHSKNLFWCHGIKPGTTMFRGGDANHCATLALGLHHACTYLHRYIVTVIYSARLYLKVH